MQFKKGNGWKACCDPERGLYTAERGGCGYYHLYEITKEIFDLLKDGMRDEETYKLIDSGRHLYMDVDDRCGPPYTVVFDDDYQTLCPWAKVAGGEHVWPAELTDAAVELFASEEANRAQRRRKREQREHIKQQSLNQEREEKRMTTDMRELLAKSLPANTEQEILDRLAGAVEEERKTDLASFDYSDLKEVLEKGNVRAGIGKGADPISAAGEALKHITDIHGATGVAMVLGGSDMSLEAMAAAQEVVYEAVGGSPWFCAGISEEAAAECTVVLLAGGGA